MALAITSIKASLIPFKICGLAKGNLTLYNVCHFVIPSPVAVSINICGTSLNPTIVFNKIGGTANTTRAIIAGNRPTPIKGIRINNRPKLGITLKP